MKKILLVLVAGCLSLGYLNAQDPVFSKGDKILNIAVGLGSTLYTGTYYKGQVPPLSVSLEIGVADNIIDEKGKIGIGPYLGYSSYKYTNQDWGWKYSNFILGAKGNFHYQFVDKLDTYVGLLLGYNIASSKEFGVTIPGYDYSYSAGGMIYGGFVGGRYYLKEKLALLAEFGYGVAYFNFGIALRL
jgi:hypothetical protein